ncbi:MAG: hypothetical protein KJ574_02870 [Nanoarchaeota archaeon]|nr:hypothetical protein [Nanoarchaeota archaeon]
MAIFSENQHKEYLELMLEAVRDVRQRRMEDIIPRITPCITDTLNVAREAGYVRLADEYASLFRQEGLTF